jgi:soluble lytic murein transglycosylase
MIESPSAYAGRVYGRAAAALLLGVAQLFAAAPVPAQALDGIVLDAREALRKQDGPRLAVARTVLTAAGHPLAMWADYWELGNRLATAEQAELDAFYARWRDTYVEDRLRNDWLLELGKRRDWGNFAVEYPRFRMNDDREVRCYALLVEHQGGKAVRDAALAAWLAQRDGDDGCTLLAATLYEARVFGAAEVWRKARAAVDANRPRVARQALALLGDPMAAAFDDAWDKPARHVAHRGATTRRHDSELTAIAIVRMSDSDPAAAARQLASRWDRALPADLAAWTWAVLGKRAAMNLLPDAADHFEQAYQRAARGRTEVAWPADALAWKARAALRAEDGRGRWKQVLQAVDAMPASEQADPTWTYWKARALLAIDDDRGGPGADAAKALLGRLAGQMDFYGQLAAEHLGLPVTMPPRPTPLMPEEQEAVAARNPGLTRALLLIGLGLRSEGVREWNFTLRGMGERELLAAAQIACEREVWDRCINTSDRTRNEIDMGQRFPMPFRAEIEAQATAIGLDPAYVYGLIRQESRFVADARSSVGAAGLMQVMPATARWTAKKIGLDYRGEPITEREVNLRIGTSYLKLVLDDFGGSMAMAAAAYNAGPSRPRKWRDGPMLEPAVWTENIPFGETRDYVKKVLSNAVWYAALLTGNDAPSLRSRLGPPIGPRPDALAVNRELP